jgi:hypothetical protein
MAANIGIGELPSPQFPNMVRKIERGVVLHAIYRRPRARTWRYLLDLDWWYPGIDRNQSTIVEILQRHGCHWSWWCSNICGQAKFQTLEAAEAALNEINGRWPASTESA